MYLHVKSQGLNWSPIPTLFLLPATKLGQGYIFTGICDSVHRGVCLSACWDTTPPARQIPLLARRSPQQGRPPPGKETPLARQPPPPMQCMLGDTVNKQVQYASYWNAIFVIRSNCNLSHWRSYLMDRIEIMLHTVKTPPITFLPASCYNCGLAKECLHLL